MLRRSIAWSSAWRQCVAGQRVRRCRGGRVSFVGASQARLWKHRELIGRRGRVEMGQILPVIILGAVVATLAVLLFWRRSQLRIPSQYRTLLVIGFVIVFVGMLLRGIERSGAINGIEVLADSALLQGVAQASQLGGFVLIVVGTIGWIVSTMAVQSPEPVERAPRKPRSDLHVDHDLLQALLRSSPNGMMVLKPIRDDDKEVVDFKCWLANPAAVQILGKPHSQLVSEPLVRLLPCLEETGLFERVLSVHKTGLPLNEEREFTQDSVTSWYHIVAVKHVDGLALTFADISERKRLEEDLRRAARHDSLTGLPNRALFKERLDQAVHRARRVEDYKFAVLFLDFDRFKAVNDSLGHDVGDELLKSIADRLRANLRAIDTASGMDESEGHLPARLGGDEFVILLDGLHEIHNAQIVAERLRMDLCVPHRISGHMVTSTASIGIVTSDGQYDCADDLMRDADTAMYRAKVEGRARCVTFDKQMHSEVIPEMALEQELRDAVARQVFMLQFQPIVSLQSGRIAGFEALIRWPHTQRGLLQAAQFIGLAQDLGVIVPMGRCVLHEAGQALLRWVQQVPAAAPLFVSVNLSNQELLQPDLPSVVQNLLEETGLEPGALRLEVAESTCTDRPQEIIPILERLRELGVTLAMDNFGTGRSSLNYLDRFPFDCIKIDQCFLEGDRKTRDRAAMIQSIVDLAHNLNMSVVAEGVETESHVSLLQALDCDYAQGWIFSEPVSAEEAENLLTRDAGMKLAG